MRIIPLWLGMIFNSFILYLDQTPLHEACHGNIAGKDSRFLWLNHLVGFVCGAILLHEYKAFRYMHLAHHRDTNDTEIDPDHWVAVQGPLNVLCRCFTIVFWYHQYFWKHIASMRTSRACARSPFTSRRCMRCSTLSPSVYRCTAIGAKC
jgi:beta-carotene hydroxylase